MITPKATACAESGEGRAGVRDQRQQFPIGEDIAVPEFSEPFAATSYQSHKNHNPTTMQFSSQQYADVAVAAPVGRIDHAGAAVLEQALSPLLVQAGSTKHAVILDFAGVEYISSVGLRVLMIAAKQMKGYGARIVIAAPQPVVAEILAISRFDRVLEIAPTVRKAVEWLSQRALAAYLAGGTEAS